MSETLAVGAMLPEARLELADGGTLETRELRGKPAVLFFYPKDDTPGCTTEAREFSALADQFVAAGVEVLGISKDPPVRHAKFIAKHGLTVQLASDAIEGGLSDALGIWTGKSLYGRKFMGMVRTTILTDAEGRIVRVWPKVKVAGHAAEVLEAARTLGG